MRRGPRGTSEDAQSTGEKAAAVPPHGTRGMKDFCSAHRERGLHTPPAPHLDSSP